MSQTPITVQVVNGSALQEQINLSTWGNLTTVGNPGGPVVFSAYGAPILTAISGAFPNTVVSANP